MNYLDDFKILLTIKRYLPLAEVKDLGLLKCQPSTNFDRSTKLDLTTEPPLLPNRFWAKTYCPKK